MPIGGQVQRRLTLPTTPGNAWIAYFRLFGPLQPYLDRTWSLPDIKPAW